jgi:hypothetical protein
MRLAQGRAQGARGIMGRVGHWRLRQGAGRAQGWPLPLAGPLATSLFIMPFCLSFHYRHSPYLFVPQDVRRPFIHFAGQSVKGADDRKASLYR